MMLHVGFTGTQTPGPDAARIIRGILEPMDRSHCIIVQGCCIGVDTLVATIARELGFIVWGVVPANRYKVDARAIAVCAFLIEMPADTSFMDRNDELVRRVDILYGLPKTEQEELRSGTWATIRRGWKKGINVGIIAVGAA